jgi:hypothetical protein
VAILGKIYESNLFTFQANTSPFALAIDKIEIDRGLKKLQQDIETKKIRTIIDRFPNPEGNFYYILLEKIKIPIF